MANTHKYSYMHDGWVKSGLSIPQGHPFSSTKIHSI